MIRRLLSRPKVETTTGGLPRDPHWARVRDRYLRDHPSCAVCGSTKKVEVHHVIPVEHARRTGHPELELDETNFISLCRRLLINHHFVVGHNRNWKKWNVNVRADAAALWEKMKNAAKHP
jgi:5-methylcytosine-specific restriction endonuclease McrA